MSQLEEEEETEAQRMFRLERGGGNYGVGTKELQQKNYIQRKEAERKRRELFDDALAKFNAGTIEEARGQALFCGPSRLRVTPLMCFLTF